jgi:hypothetical protein
MRLLSPDPLSSTSLAVKTFCLGPAGRAIGLLARRGPSDGKARVLTNSLAFSALRESDPDKRTGQPTQEAARSHFKTFSKERQLLTNHDDARTVISNLR